jgi:hypothetical protein
MLSNVRSSGQSARMTSIGCWRPCLSTPNTHFITRFMRAVCTPQVNGVFERPAVNTENDVAQGILVLQTAKGWDRLACQFALPSAASSSPLIKIRPDET